ncbi:MAG: hypothetical protein ACREOB_07630 [Thermodesulfobacteriota bacterium]
MKRLAKKLVGAASSRDSKKHQACPELAVGMVLLHTHKENFKLELV